MKHLSKATVAILSIGFLSLSTNLAMASGNIEIPEQKVNFKNHNKCMLELNKIYSGILQTKDQKLPDMPNVISKVEIESSTNGIKKIDASNAELHAKIWYHHSMANPAIGKVETSHSYTSYNYKCNGKTMFINGSQGYTLSTFEDIISKNQPAKP